MFQINHLIGFGGAIRPGGLVGPAFIGCLAHRITSDQSIASSTDVPAQFNNEQYDSDSFHDSGSNPSRFTVPVAYNGRKGRLTGNLTSDNSSQQLLAHMWKNGSLFQGAGAQDGETSGRNSSNTKGAVVALATSDYFEIVGFNSDPTSATLDALDYCWGCFEVMPADFAGALVKHSATQTIDADTNPLIMAFNGEEYDTDGFHDNAVNNSRLTVPIAFDGRYVRLSCGFRAPGAASSSIVVEIRKNGSTLHGLPKVASTTAGSDFFSMMSAPVLAAVGDYFEVYVTYSNTTAQTVPAADPNVWFQIEVMPTTFSGALVKRSTDQVIASTTDNFIGEVEEYDVGGWWSSGNPTRLTVPAGVTKVRVSANAGPSSTTGQFIITLSKNGASFVGVPRQELDSTGNPETGNIVSAVIEVSPGDFFEFPITVDTVENFTSAAHNWFAIEAMES